jgi:hypothetical protein
MAYCRKAGRSGRWEPRTGTTQRGGGVPEEEAGVSAEGIATPPRPRGRGVLMCWRTLTTAERQRGRFGGRWRHRVVEANSKRENP